MNYSKNGVTIGTAPLIGNRINPAYLAPSNSALTNSFLNASGHHQSQQQQQQQSPAQQQQPDVDRYHTSGGNSHQLGRQPSLDGGLPAIDTPSYSSNPTSAYGSPLGPGLSGYEDHHNGQRGVLGLSPMNANVMSVMDAPLPASFDSNSISHAARYGPWPSSVPSKFGLESPTPSLHNAKDERTSETLKLLYNSAFGNDGFSSPASHLVPHDGVMGSSPPAFGGAGGLSAGGSGSGSGAGGAGSGTDEYYYSKRMMHSSSTRYAKPRLLSSSAPKVDRDWDSEFLFLEEDYVPGTLANEVLTPQEKARRGSIRLNDGADGLLLSEMPAQSASASANASANATKFGSPSTAASAGAGAAASSPSRWSPWLQQRQRSSGGGSLGASAGGAGSGSGIGNGAAAGATDDDFEPGSVGRSMKHAASAFGHVGSPLRNASFASNMELNGKGGTYNGSSAAGLGNGNGNGSVGGIDEFASGRSVGSRSGSMGGGESMSVLTQQLQRTRLGSDDASAGSGSSAVGGVGGNTGVSSTAASTLSPRLRPNLSSARNPSASLSAAAVTAAAAAGIIGRDPRDFRDARDRDRGLERHVSSSSIGSSSAVGRFPAPIDEEDTSFVFDMEEVVDDPKALKRKSGSGLSLGGGSSTTTGHPWSYVVAGGKSKAGRDASNGVVR